MEKTNFHLCVHSASAYSTYMHTVHTSLNYKCINIQPQIGQYIIRERGRETETDRQTDKRERQRKTERQ